ncbi:KH domain protein [Trichodelitschia bisporula]|uniref:KH domain protein n=1 Tax=Trichodelitschia bisporula TaxID=703511 RepID=A0A6G1I125_9PEZI|nr:KH domain protein [Trichodelitschia bisporula]
MQTVSGIASSARSGWDRMTRGPPLPFAGPRSASNDLHHPQALKRGPTAANEFALHPNTPISLSFNIPFNTDLAGPKNEEIQYATPNASVRWCFPEGSENLPVHELPVHVINRRHLEALCGEIAQRTNGGVKFYIRTGFPLPVDTTASRSKASVTNVCLRGPKDTVAQARAFLLNNIPISMRCTTIDIDEHLVCETLPDGSKGLSPSFLRKLDDIAQVTQADIFVLKPKLLDDDASINGSITSSNESRLRVVVYGDMLTEEHARIRLLIMVDNLRGYRANILQIKLPLHTAICGRGRKNITAIESGTDCTIYLPPAFPRIYEYVPQGGRRRPEDEIIVTGKDENSIQNAMMRLRNLAAGIKTFGKDVSINQSKLDDIRLGRLDKVRRIMEANGTYVHLQPLGSPEGGMCVQGSDVLNVERTIRDVMALATQFYSARWIAPSHSELAAQSEGHFAGLADICINSGAEIMFEASTFHIFGSDDAVKLAMCVIDHTEFGQMSTSISVKVELANEHKEFVSGKKNGKINKIMTLSNVQVMFESFNEYNFYINIKGGAYEATKQGLELIEQEMPASLSFHVPDQYHKRIIGIGGQHIQRIMKKHSVFVKFSNAMDRGAHGRDEDDMKVDNVICRTPTRNAGSLEFVKQEIMSMIDQEDAEHISEVVEIPRLLQRDMIARMPEIHSLEKKHGVKVCFSNPEEAKNSVTVSGPEYRVPNAVDALLGMVPQFHEIVFTASPELKVYLRSPQFHTEVIETLHTRYCIDVRLSQDFRAPEDAANSECLILNYTRNNAGALKDAIDWLIEQLVTKGLDVNSGVKGVIPRPKSDTFEEALPFFDSKLLQRTEPPINTDSPTRSQFGDVDGEQAGFFSKIRKPGSISSLIDRHKNGTNSPGSLFKHASSNASKASLASLESQGSGYRNPWNDSGINLPEEDVKHHINGTWSTHPPSLGSTYSFMPTIPLVPGDTTPTSKYDPRASVDSGRPSTSHSYSPGYPGPIGHLR